MQLITKINIFDILGKAYSKVKINNSSLFKIDVSALPKGLYIANIVTDNNTIYKKIIKD